MSKILTQDEWERIANLAVVDRGHGYDNCDMHVADLREDRAALIEQMGAIGRMWGSIPVIESHHAVLREQCRFPRSKKRRIRKKWAKRPANFHNVPRAYQLANGTIICHPTIAAALRAKLTTSTE